VKGIRRWDHPSIPPHGSRLIKTTMTDAIDFDAAFEALTGNSPFGWQRRLFERLRCGDIPYVCDLPTGLGKTSVIPIWTIALARQVQDGPPAA